MSEASSDIVAGLSSGTVAHSGVEAGLDLNQGFLGTGSSTLVELSYIAILMIAVYIAHGALRYFMPGFSLSESIFGALGLRD